MLLLLSLGHAMYCLVDVWISCLLWMVCVLYEMYWCWYTQTHICFWVSQKNYWFFHQLILIHTYVWTYCSVNLQYQKLSENIAFIQLLFFIIVIISFSFLLLLLMMMMMMMNLLFLTVNSWVFIHFLILIMLVYKTTITNHTTTTNYTTTTKIYPATTMIRMKQYFIQKRISN